MKSDAYTAELNELRAISFFSTSLYMKESIEEVLWDITKNVVHQLGFVDCVIYQFDPKRGLLFQRAAYGQKNPAKRVIYNRITIELGEDIVGCAAENMKAELVVDTSVDPRYIIDDEERLSELSVPIMVNNNLFGIIDTEHPSRNYFTEKHLHLLHIIAALCSQKIKELSQQGKKPFNRANSYFKKLEELMRFRKIYRKPNLSLSSTADLLGISACYLSSMVNAIIEGSFIDYINGYRVADVKKNLHAHEFSHYTILSVGLEAGFNSKSAFYNAFRKHTGMSPSDFKTRENFNVPIL